MSEYFTREEAQRFAERYGLPEGLGKPNWHHILNEVFNAKLAALDSASTARGLLQDLVNALDSAYISSWQSTARWSDQLTAAREYLEDLKETP